MKFNSLDDAFFVYFASPDGSEAKMAAIAFILDNCPPELKEDLYRLQAKHFPDLKPIGYDDKGEPCYSLEDIAGQLGLDEDEVNRVIEMRKDIPSMFVAPGTVLHKVQ